MAGRVHTGGWPRVSNRLHEKRNIMKHKELAKNTGVIGLSFTCLAIGLVFGGLGVKSGAQTEPPAQKSPDAPLAQTPRPLELPSVNSDLPSPDTREVVAGNTEFALDLYGKLRTSKGNLFFSPYSISIALAMTCGGARGETEKQMAQTLHFNLPPERLHPAFAGLAAHLGAIQQKGQVKLALANSLWPQVGSLLRQDYLALCQNYYNTAITPVDYMEQKEVARKTINDWVEAKTGGKIVELLQSGTLDTSTRLVLANAVYFKGAWASPFRAGSTRNPPFHISSQNSVTAPLMQQVEVVPYAESPGLQVVELSYLGGDLSMLVLLPAKVDGLGDLEAEMTPQTLTSWTSNLQTKSVQVCLPRFKTTSEFSLQATLKALGMSDAFTFGRADFSGMDGQKDLFVSAVVHKAFVEVNEQGTEAAAATATGMGGRGNTGPPIPIFRADHPFLFLIRDNHTGSLLFLGRVTDPTK